MGEFGVKKLSAIFVPLSGIGAAIGLIAVAMVDQKLAGYLFLVLVAVYAVSRGILLIVIRALSQIAGVMQSKYRINQKIRHHPMSAELQTLRRAISKLQNLAYSDVQAKKELDRVQSLYEDILCSEIKPGSALERPVDKRIQKNRSAIDEVEAEFQFMQDQGYLRRERE